MSKKYHVNPAGVPGECTAGLGKCPFASDDEHYGSVEEARNSYERKNEQLQIPEVSRKAKNETQAKVDAIQDLKHKEQLLMSAAREAGKRPGGDSERMDLFREAQSTSRMRNSLIRALEDEGLGHAVPDNGKTIRVANKAQKVLLEKEILGQISDGYWENVGGDHWQSWSESDIIIDPQNVGRNFYARKDNYQLNAKGLLDVVGDRMVKSVQKDADPNYDARQMNKDLRELRKIFKTKRDNHEGSPATSQEPATPTPYGRGAAPVQSSNIRVPRARENANGSPNSIEYATTSTGSKRPRGRLQGVLRGKGDVTDPSIYGLSRTGGAYILAKDDGTRARAYVPSTAPSEMTGLGNMGRQIALDKVQKAGKLARTDGLRIVGFVDQKGNTHGWVPEGKINIFFQDTKELD